MEKINSDLLALTYGAFVVQLIKDYKDINVVNQELHKIGYNMGIRMVEELLAKANISSCENFRETAQVIAKIGFKMFLGINAEVTNWSEDGRSFILSFRGNPFNEFVELPPACADLNYSNIICGAITGALRMLQLVVECKYVSDELKGAPENEIRVTLKEVMREVYHDDEE